MTQALDPARAKIADRIHGLLVKGQALLETEAEVPDDPELWMLNTDGVDESSYIAWNMQCTYCLESTLGPGHEYTDTFRRHVMPQKWNIRTACAVLEAIEEDINQGYLTDFQELIHAEVFSDFTDMAEYLLSEHYKDPAAVLAGGVLEEQLRKLCRKHGIATEIQRHEKTRPKSADEMNIELMKAEVYPGNEQKQVLAWLGIRNSAAHGKYSEYVWDDVDRFIQGLRIFISRYPA